jgi:GTPase Era involved in 16S rRNA processing
MGLARTSVNPPPSQDLAGLLASAIAQLASPGTSGASVGPQLRELRDRLGEGRFHLAVLGQFKRGKSTFINALLEWPLLPTSVIPLTALPTFIRWGERAEAQVQFQDDRAPEAGPTGTAETLEAFLARFVTEAGNPQNQKGVSQVDVWFPSPLLQEGLVVIDTPGIGSTWKHNTEATLQFLPQCDAAVFMVSPDPPMTEVEVDFLCKVREKASRILFVLNKVDYLAPEDRDVIRSFLRQTLESNLGFPTDTVIHEVSSRRGLQAVLDADPSAWQESGMALLRERLQDFIRREKTQVLETSVRRKAVYLLDEALLGIQLTLKAITLPIEDLENRLGQFEARIQEIQHERVAAGDLLAGDRKRAHAQLEAMTEELRQNARLFLMDLVKAEMDAHLHPTEAAIQERLAKEIPEFFESALETIASRFTTDTEKLLAFHQQRADRLLEGLRRTAASLFDLPYRAPEGAGAFEMKRDPYWVSRQWTDSLSPISPAWVDRLLPAAARRHRILSRIRDQVGLLVMRNAENLRWSLYQGLDESIYRFSASLDERLAATLQTTREGMVLGMNKRKEETGSIQGEVTRLEDLAGQLGRIREELGVVPEIIQ